MTTIPTIGFNVESVTYKNLNFNVWVRPRMPWLGDLGTDGQRAVGFGWTNKYPTVLEVLLRQHRSSHFRR